MLVASMPASSLELGSKALKDFRPDEAVTLLERAQKEGPYPYADYVKLHEQLGTAYAYLDRSDEALEVFRKLLVLDPGYAISYTLSPKVTFLFEEARKRAQTAPKPTVDVSWPRDLDVEAIIPVHIEVLSDPLNFLKRASFRYRLRGTEEYATLDSELLQVGQDRGVQIPAIAEDETKDTGIEVYLTVYDEAGNEVFLWGQKDRPREINLRYVQKDAWYDKWWVWTLVGGAIAAGGGTAAILLTRDPSPTIPAQFEVGP